MVPPLLKLCLVSKAIVSQTYESSQGTNNGKRNIGDDEIKLRSFFMFLKFCSTDRFPLLFLILHLQKKHSCYLLIILNAFQNDASIPP